MTDTAPSLVCIGNLTIDEAVSPAGTRVESVGGDALFAALAARLAGGNPTVLAPLGTDATPTLLAAIRSAGTDPATLPRRELPTIRNVIHYDDTGAARPAVTWASGTTSWPSSLSASSSELAAPVPSLAGASVVDDELESLPQAATRPTGRASTPATRKRRVRRVAMGVLLGSGRRRGRPTGSVRMACGVR